MGVWRSWRDIVWGDIKETVQKAGNNKPGTAKYSQGDNRYFAVHNAVEGKLFGSIFMN